MNTKQIRDKLISSGIEFGEAQREAEMFAEHYLGLNAVKLAINPEFEPTEEMSDAILKRCQKKIPIQHLLGKAYFMGEYFKVNENVLIPRDETEILTVKVINIVKENGFKYVLDIGTGSGCIACMVAKHTDAQVLGVDISTAALSVALDNTSALGLFNRAIFRKSDLFSNVFEKFDLIVSNPPYIPLSEKNKIQKEVRFDPELALYTKDESGVEFYKKITEQSSKYLNDGGYLVFELGMGQAGIVKKFFEENDFKDIEIIKDLAYIDRVIIGRKNG
ncbi:peptide chain release factor N(5)-glutamine methyltransferase [bacterium]|nr:peptide chain release factor N(5)-glutamine methyltransferase [bacterium]